MARMVSWLAAPVGRTWKALAAVVLAAALYSPAALAQATALAAVPDDCLGLVIVNRLADSNARVQKLTSTMHLGVPSLLQAAQQMFGLEQGLDDRGPLILAAMPDTPDVAVGVVTAVFVPVTNYRALLESLRARNPDAPTSEVSLSGNSMLAGRKGDFAVLVPPRQKRVLEHIMASEASVLPALESLQPWIDAQQAAMVLTASGLKVLTRSTYASLDEIGSEVPGAELAETAVIARQPKEWSDAVADFKALWDGAQSQIKLVAIGVHVDEQQGLEVAVRVPLTVDGSLARWGGALQPPRRGPLGGLPQNRFVFAFGGTTLGQKLVAALSQLNSPAWHSLGMNDIDERRYVELLELLTANRQSSSGMMCQLRPGDTLTSTMVMIERVTDAAEYLRLNREAIGILAQATMPKDNVGPVYVVNDFTLGDLTGLEVTIDLGKLTRESTSELTFELLKGFLTRMFGSDGISRAYIVAADSHSVVTAYSKELLQRGVAHVRKDAAGLEADPAIVNTTSQMPGGAQWAMFVNPQGVLHIIDSVLHETMPPELAIKIPAFPSSDPFGLAAKATDAELELELVAPQSLITAIGKYLKTLEEMVENGELRVP